MRTSRIVRIAAVATAVVATAGMVLGSVGGGDNAAPGAGADTEISQGTGTAAGKDHTTTVAEAVGASVTVFDVPNDGKPIHRLANPQPSGGPLVFVVDERQPGWAQVQLPVRPNGSTGWVRTDEVNMSQHDFRVEVDVGARRLVAYEGAKVILDETIAVGRSETPTPLGRFYVKELLQPPDPNGPYGAYAFGLSGFSDVLTEFAGGEGVIGIHGTNDQSTLGAEASAGCIRLSNEAITALADRLHLGTPVEIRA